MELPVIKSIFEEKKNTIFWINTYKREGCSESQYKMMLAQSNQEYLLEIRSWRREDADMVAFEISIQRSGKLSTANLWMDFLDALVSLDFTLVIE